MRVVSPWPVTYTTVGKRTPAAVPSQAPCLWILLGRPVPCPEPPAQLLAAETALFPLVWALGQESAVS